MEEPRIVAGWPLGRRGALRALSEREQAQEKPEATRAQLAHMARVTRAVPKEIAGATFGFALPKRAPI